MPLSKAVFVEAGVGRGYGRPVAYEQPVGSMLGGLGGIVISAIQGTVNGLRPLALPNKYGAKALIFYRYK
jgi:hypothetical protein